MLSKKRFALSMLLIALLAFSGAAVAYNEAPMLAERVAAGELPPVEERLPVDPVVVPVYEEIGQYGGTWNRLLLGLGDYWGMPRIMGENYYMWDKDVQLMANLAANYELNEDATEMTLYLREGVRWSDGHPFTADDVLFFFNDILRYSPDPDEPVTFTAADMFNNNTEITKVDDYTVHFVFDRPVPNIQRGYLTTPSGMEIVPSHYLKQFHPRYMDDVPEYGEEAVAQWDIFLEEDDRPLYNINRPHLGPWIPVEYASGQYFRFERNPYYFKVDAEGNQLPYIDEIFYTIVENQEVANLQAMSGAVDMQFRHMRMENYPAFIQSQERGNYRVLEWDLAMGGNPALFINQDYEGPEGDLLRTKEFRMALSHGIDRDYINDVYHFGLAIPMTATIPPGSDYYIEGYENMYAEFDPDFANELLDGLGLTEWVGDYRKEPWGNGPLTIVVDTTDALSEGGLELIQESWSEIGIRMVINNVERGLLQTRHETAEHHITVWQMDRVLLFDLLPGFHVVPTSTYVRWAPRQGEYFESNGARGKEPTPEVARMQELYVEAPMMLDAADRLEAYREIVEIFTENVWVLGTVGNAPVPVIVSNNMRNVAEYVVGDNPLQDPRQTFPEQYFFVQ